MYGALCRLMRRPTGRISSGCPVRLAAGLPVGSTPAKIAAPADTRLSIEVVVAFSKALTMRAQKGGVSSARRRQRGNYYQLKYPRGK